MNLPNYNPRPMNYKSLFLALMFIPVWGVAQESLTLEKAIDAALTKNFDILVSRNDADATKANNTLGNAGILPTVNLNGSATASQTSEYQRLTTGAENTGNPGKLSANVGVELSWTLYDGGKMFVTREKLQQLEQLGSLRYREIILQTTYDVVAAYYNIIRLQQQMRSMDETIRYNKEREALAELALRAGSKARPELLQARIDYNEAVESSITQKFAILEAKRELNVLLGRRSETPFEVTDTLVNTYQPNADELFKQLELTNPQLLAFQKLAEISKLALDETKSKFLPRLSLTAGVYQSVGQNSEGTVQRYSNLGPQVSARLSIPLYQAGEAKRLKTLAALEQKTAQLEMDKIKLEMQATLQNALDEFNNQKQLLEIETSNNLFAKEYLDISIERLRWGQTTSLEVHQAQASFVNSNTRLYNFKFALKLAETRLKQLVSGLAQVRAN